MNSSTSACDLLLYRCYQEYWTRGQAYEKQGRVKILKHDDKAVQATVKGTQDYTVSLAFKSGGLSRQCNCPVSDFCKHIIATAIAWDKARGITPPNSLEIENISIPPPLITRVDLNKAYADPIKADLEVIRIAAEELGWGGRPHARLPNQPKSLINSTSRPVTRPEIKKCFTEIRSWSRKSNFDHYFCAGEMVSAFCEVLRTIYERFIISDLEQLAQILILAQQFHYEIIMEMIDDSDGLHLFTEAHLEKLYKMIKEKNCDQEEKVLQLLTEFDQNRDNY